MLNENQHFFFKNKEEAGKADQMERRVKRAEATQKEIDAYKSQSAQFEQQLQTLQQIIAGLNPVLAENLKLGLAIISKEKRSTDRLLKNAELRSKIDNIYVTGELSNQQKAEFVGLLNDQSVKEWLSSETRRELIALLENGPDKITLPELPLGFLRPRERSEEEKTEALGRDDLELFNLYKLQFFARTTSEKNKIQEEIDNLRGKIKQLNGSLDTSLRGVEARYGRVDEDKIKTGDSVNKDDVAKAEGNDEVKQQDAEPVGNEPKVEQAPQAPEVDQANIDFSNKYLTGRDLLTKLETNIDPLVATEVNRLIPLLETILAEMGPIIDRIKDEKTREKNKKAWERMNMAGKVKAAKEKVAPAPEPAGTPEAEASATEEATTESASTAENDQTAAEDEQETVLPLRTRIWNSITTTFTGITGWFGRNLGGRDESDGQPAEPKTTTANENQAGTSVTTSETQANAPTARVEKKMSSQEIFDLQLRSLGRIETNLKNILFRKNKDVVGPPGDAEAFAFALDSLYMTDLEVVNNVGGTNLNPNHQERLNAVISRISKVLEENIGQSWDQIVVDMENAVPEKATLLDETEDRKKWFVRLYNGEQNFEPAVPDVNKVVVTVLEPEATEAELPQAPAEMPNFNEQAQNLPGLDESNL